MEKDPGKRKVSVVQTRITKTKFTNSMYNIYIYCTFTICTIININRNTRFWNRKLKMAEKTDISEHSKQTLITEEYARKNILQNV